MKRTVRTSDSIVLYMPATIQTNTNAVYKNTELGGMAMETAQRVMDTVSKVDMAGGMNSWGGIEAIWDAIPGFANQGLQEVEKGIIQYHIDIDTYFTFIPNFLKEIYS